MMHLLRPCRIFVTKSNLRQQNPCALFDIPIFNVTQRTVQNNINRFLHSTTKFLCKDNTPQPLRRLKRRSEHHDGTAFVDIKYVRAIGGNGGDGEISLLQLWANENAGPDGGDGGNGGHIIFKAADRKKDLGHISCVVKGSNGEKGQSKSCFGKSATHSVIEVPVGTIIRNLHGKIIADLNENGVMFIAARGGAGGHGNIFFKSDINQTPKISELGAEGETIEYILELRSMAHIGLIGFPNAGKSTLLRAISRARPKVAPYPFTTLKPHLGIVSYDDYEQIAVADLPGLVTNAHKNEGLGITFLKHAERCAALLFVLDMNGDKPWQDFDELKYEISQFNPKLCERPLVIVANKMDIPWTTGKLEELRTKVDIPIVPVSAKMGTNLLMLLNEVRRLYDSMKEIPYKDNDATV